MSDVAILILAAGGSTRMGGSDKLLEKVDTKPLLRHVAAQALRTGCPVFVTLPPRNQARLATLSGLPLTQVEVESANTGLASSMRTGIALLPKTTGAVMVLLADMPDLDLHDLKQMLASHAEAPDAVHRGVEQSGRPGHPVIFPARLFGQLSQLSGDQGARSVIAGETVVPVTLPDGHATTDLDTPEDWLSWRRANPFRN